MKQFTLSTTINLTHKIEDLREDLEFKLEKSSLPRPQALGKIHVVTLVLNPHPAE